MSKIIKVGTQVKINPNWDKAHFHTDIMGKVGTVIGRWRKSSYTIDFGEHRQVIIEPSNMIIVSNRPFKYSHPHAPDADRVHRFTQQLHGSGIDYDWKIQETKSSIRASNAYHTMDEMGGYDRIVDFTVIFPKGETMENFKLTFGDSYGAKKYGLHEYLGYEVSYALERAGL